MPTGKFLLSYAVDLCLGLQTPFEDWVRTVFAYILTSNL